MEVVVVEMRKREEEEGSKEGEGGRETYRTREKRTMIARSKEKKKS